jgi:hypothetical protein
VQGVAGADGVDTAIDPKRVLVCDISLSTMLGEAED